jgi:hypothetical protein
MVLSVLLSVGCVKTIPQPDQSYDASQRVVLKLRGDREIQGRIAAGRRVEYREPKLIWSARVKENTEDRLVLTDLVMVRERAGVALQSQRQAEGRIRVDSPAQDVTLLKNEVESVELVKTDVAKTARNATFWAYGAAVLSLLLGDRS